MKLMAAAITKYILDESKKNIGRTLRFILPSYPPDLLYEIGRSVAEGVLKIKDYKVQFEYGIAYKLGEKWEKGTQEERNIFSQIKERNWYNDTDNLTRLRHLIKRDDYDCLVVLLAGYEDIRDQASLQDFFHLDQKTVWEICLKKSFEPWIIEAARKYINPEGNEEAIKKIAALFSDLYHFGLADPLLVSRYLDAKDFSKAIDGRDALKLVLADLSKFGLPNMIGVEKQSRKSFKDYLPAAQKFMNYSSFVDDKNKRKFGEKIDLYRKKMEGQEGLEKEVLGIYGNQEELLASLEQYINTASREERDKLSTADFIYVHDKILQFKPPSRKGTDEGKTVEKTVRIKGNILEVFLRALWQSLAEFKKDNKNTFILDEIAGISVKSLEFKHQYEDKDKAQDFLKKLLGGIDEYLEDHLAIERTDRSLIKVESSISPAGADNDDDEINYVPAKTAMPGLTFEVAIYGQNVNTLNKRFMWLMEDNCQARFLVQLFNWARGIYENHVNIMLPVFRMQYVNEMFMVKDEEDVIRILNLALEKQSCAIEDLYSASNLNQDDILKDSVYKLSMCYQEFLDEYHQGGFIFALSNKYDPLRKAYTELFDKYLPNSSKTSLGPFLMKAFMAVSEKYIKDSDWQWKESLACGVITPLHPALLEMIHHQHAYLCKSFCSYIKEELAKSGTRGLSEKNWDRLVDLAQIKWPIVGILDDENRLNTNMLNYNYIHLFGTPEGEYSTASSRLLVKYEEIDDEDISDVELFRESQMGRLIKQVLLDYCKLHPYADDGLNIGVYCGGSIQQVIGGIDAFLSEVADNAEDVYSLSLTIFSDSPDDTAVLSWINAWKERWQEAKDTFSRKYYANSKITLYYRVAAKGDREQLERLIKQADFDLIFFTNFTRPRYSQFIPLKDNCPCSFDDYLKFPVLEKVNCAVVDGGKAKERKLVLNNRRFILGALHGEVMNRLQNPYGPDGEHVIVIATDFSPWESVIDAAHDSSVWVVCIDPVVDEKLIRKEERKREIIGFGTGVGPHGEYNFTVSTELFNLSHIVNKISEQFASITDSHDKNTCNEIAKSLINEALRISGLSVVKATGPSQYVRDFIAYALVRKLLPGEDGVFCDEIISLDAFLHWFDFGPGDMRPDLLRLQAKMENGFFKIKAQIIECKLAQESEGYLEKALRQVEEGLKHLVPKFRPRQSITPVGIEDHTNEGYPPDQRYWWMQLHRLISSRGEIHKAQEIEALQALENLSDGCYDIEWEAAVVAFWIDIPKSGVNKIPQWSFNVDNQELNIYSVQCERDFIFKVILEKAKFDLFDGLSAVRYQHVRPEVICSTKTEAQDEAENLKLTDLDLSGSESNNQKEQDHDRIVSLQQRTASIPKRILLGSGTAGGRDVFWEFGHFDLPNRHLLIFGASGTGKTYTIQAIIAELSKCGINSLIVDYTSGFTNNQLEPVIIKQLNPKQHVIRRQPLAINPFRKQCDYIDDEPLEDTSAQVAQRASGVFAEVYRLGEQQKSVLYNVIQAGVEEGENFNLNLLIEKLEEIRAQGGATANPAITVLNKIKPFIDMNPFGKEEPESWEKLFLDPDSRCHVIQLAGFMKDAARLITEFSLIDLYWYYRTRGSKDKPRVIVLDEIQNLDHGLESPLGQFLTEGRKFGISLILATQTLSNLSKDERDRLFQASHKLFFKPADTEIKTFAQLIADTTNENLDSWIQRLAALKRGECYSLGYAYNPGTDKLEVNRAFKIKINPLEERF